VRRRLLEHRREIVRGDYCNGCHDPGLDRGWLEIDATRLRHARSVS
jgi:hypothetical protein